MWNKTNNTNSVYISIYMRERQTEREKVIMFCKYTNPLKSFKFCKIRSLHSDVQSE